MFIKSTVASIHSHVLGLDLHTPLTDSPRATSCPAGSIHGKHPKRYTIFYLSCCIFTILFLCLENKYFPPCNNCLQYPYSNTWYRPLATQPGVCSRLYHLGVCKCALYEAGPTTKLPKDAFLRT